MKNELKKAVFLLLISFLYVSGPITAQSTSGTKENHKKPHKFPLVKGPYLGQTPPGLKPKLFAPFTVSPEHHKHSKPAFSPDGKELYFSVYFNNKHPQKIVVLKKVKGIWNAPQIAPFSGTYQDGGPSFSPDGKRLYFYSKRPLQRGGELCNESNVWYVERKGKGWGEPRLASFNNEKTTGGLSFADNGTIYYYSGTRKAGYDIYKITFKDGIYSQPEKLGDAINTGKYIEGTPMVPADESYLIFFSFNRPNAYSRGDLYISFRNKDGSWGQAKNMGPAINVGNARFPGLSPDGKYFFFCSYRSGPEEMYWVDAKLINLYRTHDLDFKAILLDVIEKKGLNAAERKYKELKSAYSHLYNFKGDVLTGLSYQLLGMNKMMEAKKILTLLGISFPKQRSTLQRILVALLGDDLKDFDKLELELLAKGASKLNVKESELNNLGYRFLSLKLMDRAIKVFQLNVKFFPSSANVYDSLGEAWLKKGDNLKAIKNYEKTLQLKPDNKTVEALLEKIKLKEQ